MTVLASRDTAGLQAAINSGRREIVIPQGNYNVSGLEIPTDGDSILVKRQKIIGQGDVRFYVPSTSNAIGLKLTKRRFIELYNVRFISKGTKSDGNNTTGVQMMGNNGRLIFRDVRCEGFSGAGIRGVQCLSVSFYDVEHHNCVRGYSFEKDGIVVPTSVHTYGGYISGCTRGIFGDNLVGAGFHDLIIEESGASGTTDGAIHFTSGTRNVNFYDLYLEANIRNVVLSDARVDFMGDGPSVGTPAGADSVVWSGVAAVDRGLTKIGTNFVATRNLLPDTLGGFDCNVGDMIVPLAADGVAIGRNSAFGKVESIPFTAVNATWTTVKTFAAGEMSGAGAGSGGETRVAYDYTIYVGRTDLFEFFDSGTIMNGSIYSHSGSLPATLRMSGNDLQVNVTATSYGLSGRVILWRKKPGLFT